MKIASDYCADTVVVMCGDEDIIRKFMLAAYDSGMTSGDYVFISLTLLPSERVRTPWIRHDSRDNDAMRAYRPLLEAWIIVHRRLKRLLKC